MHQLVSLQTIEDRSHSFIIHAASLGFLTWVTCYISVTWQVPQVWNCFSTPLPFTPVTNEERQMWMVFQDNTSLVVTQQVKHMHSMSQSQCGSTSYTHRRLPLTAVWAPPCCVCWNHSYLTRENVFGCPWSRAVRDGEIRQAGRVMWGRAVGGEEGRCWWGPLGGWASKWLKTFVFLSHLWRGGKRWTGMGAEHSRGLAEVQEWKGSKMQCYKIYSIAARPLLAGMEIPK